MLKILERKQNMESSATFRNNIHRVGNAVKMVEATGDVMHLRVALAQSGLKELEDLAIDDPLLFCKEWRSTFSLLTEGKKL